MHPDIHELRRTTFARVPDEKAFWMCRGDRITTLVDLANCIESISQQEFEHHAHPEGKSDFAAWVRDVLVNQYLARDLEHEINRRDKEHCVKTIRHHIAWLEHA